MVWAIYFSSSFVVIRGDCCIKNGNVAAARKQYALGASIKYLSEHELVRTDETVGNDKFSLQNDSLIAAGKIALPRAILCVKLGVPRKCW